MDKRILVTGASGFVGGNLVKRLLAENYPVRCFLRDPERVANRTWKALVEFVVGDVLSKEARDQAMQGVTTAFYLIHNMASGKNYHQRDNEAARLFAEAAEKAGVQHIIYLGGLVDPRDKIGLHMRSRIETGEILRQGSVPVTEFRASLVIGSGSISFEMIRFLGEFFPILVGHSWMKNLAQPIAIQNVLDYLQAAIENPTCRGKIYEIGGSDSLTYAETMLAYTRLRKLKRKFLILPGIPVRLMAWVVGLLTPVPRQVAEALIGGMRSKSIVLDHQAEVDFPSITRLDYRSAVSASLENLNPQRIERVWDASARLVRLKHEGFFIEHRALEVDAKPEAVFQVLTSLGGKQGWLYLNGLWKLRGWLDRMCGGVGLRGRSNQHALEISDVIDFYRVEAVEDGCSDRNDRSDQNTSSSETGCLIRLKAEVKAPGLGWMEWQVTPLLGGNSRLSQVAFFAPQGFWGFVYWYGLFLVHTLVFAGLIRKIGKIAMRKRLPRQSDSQ